MTPPASPSEHSSSPEHSSPRGPESPARARPTEQDRRVQQLTFRAQALEKKRAAVERTLRDLLEGLLEVDDILADAVRRTTADEANGADGTGRPGATQAGPGLLEEQLGAAHRVLRRRLLAAGVEPMDLVGSRAVPSISRVVAREPRASVPADTVLEERVTGFYADREVLREALVVVAVPGRDPEPEPDPEPTAEPDAAPPTATPVRPRRQPRRPSRRNRRKRRT
ncbi:nucleotide exchange factor GrpE [Streptomyces sp. NPDC088745]|uniref:nucleotide exchange factor GrpE n=1 Tax=Streptomyces sp. NPDC088745 TaxID=3365884 RepID=UPI00381AD2E2